MKIDVPFEIGDPVIVLECNQHDGYCIEYKGFAYKHIPEVGKTVFKTYEEAKIVLSKLNEKYKEKR